MANIFQPPCVTKDNYYDEAKVVINSLVKNNEGKFILTTSQIRNLLSMVNEIYNELISEDVFRQDHFTAKINKLKVRMTYESGRKSEVKDFIDKSGLLTMLKTDNTEFMLFHNYFEALVAFHKFYGGKD